MTPHRTGRDRPTRKDEDDGGNWNTTTIPNIIFKYWSKMSSTQRHEPHVRRRKRAEECDRAGEEHVVAERHAADRTKSGQRHERHDQLLLTLMQARRHKRQT